MRVVVETLTPEAAGKLLRSSADVRQRPLDPQRVRLYARKMTDGQWRATHQPIAIGADGRLFDGQHRVAAVEQAGIAVEMTIAYDADPSTFDLVDTGRVRSPSQILAMAGFVNTNVLAASIRYYLVARLIAGTKRIPTAELKAAWTPHDIVRYASEPAGEAVLLTQSDAARMAGSLGRHGIKTWLSAAIALLQDVDPELRAEFLERLEHGARLDEGSPILAYRRWIMAESGYNRARSDVRGYAGIVAFIRTWNAWIEDTEHRTPLFWRPGVDEMPEVKLHRTPTLVDA